jgi:hypothetical protein
MAVGGLFLVGGFFILAAAIFLETLFATWAPVPMGWLTGFIFFIALLPLVYGAVTVIAGMKLNQGAASAHSLAVAVNVLSVVLAVFTIIAAAGVGLVHGALSGIALWALFQPDMKAYFGT